MRPISPLWSGHSTLARRPWRARSACSRRDGWFKDQGDDRHYALNFRGRILASTLQVLAQPFAEGDASPLATGIFLLADEMGARPELLGGFFDAAVASLEDSAREMEALLESEDSALIAARLHSSKRDQKMAGQALDLREQGAVTNDQLQQVQRMHEAIVHVSEATHRLNRRQQELIARDLLARDLVTLGDIVAWAQGAGIDELAASLAGHLRLPLQPVWAGTERQLIEAYLEVDGREPAPARGRVPVPLPVASADIGREMSEARRQLLRARRPICARDWPGVIRKGCPNGWTSPNGAPRWSDSCRRRTPTWPKILSNLSILPRSRRGAWPPTCVGRWRPSRKGR